MSPIWQTFSRRQRFHVFSLGPGKIFGPREVAWGHGPLWPTRPRPQRKTIYRESLLTTVLVTGGAGYIGSHTVLALLEAGYEVVVLDNLCNSSREPLRRVERLTGRSLDFVQADIRDRALLDRLFAEYAVE